MRSARSRPLSRSRLTLLAVMVLTVIGAAAPAQPALAAYKQSPLNSNPLTIWVGDNGWFQDLVAGNNDNSFFPPHEPQTSNASADAGLVLAFPSSQAGAFSVLAGQTWGWTTDNGNGLVLDGQFAPLSQGNWIGSGTEADPYSQETTYTVLALLEIDQTTRYVNGSSSFVTTYVVKNLSADPVNFRALVGADVYLNSSDCGVGVFKGGPPRFVGGSSLGRVGGFTEASSPSPSWTRYFEGPFGGPPGPCQLDLTPSQGVWDYLMGAETGEGFPNTVDTSNVDNGIGVQWDTYFTGALPGTTTPPIPTLASTSVPFQLNTLGFVPGELSLLPSTQSVNAGSQATLAATALEASGGPATGISLRYAVSGANSASGTATTNGAGQATISYTPTHAGTDTLAAYEDIDANGVHGTGEPHATATVTVQGAGPPDRTPPGLTISARRSLKRKALLKGLLALARCNEACSLKFELRGTKGRRSKRLTRSLVRKSLPIAGAGKRAVILKPERKLVSRARKFTIQLRVTATDRAGNRTVKTRLVKVK